MTAVDALIAEGLSTPISGWDFTRFGSRATAEPASWDFTGKAASLVTRAESVLDMGTGGGEWLSGILDPHRPPFVLATEGWRPNVPVAARRLAGHGVPVVEYEGAPDNVEQVEGGTEGALPFSVKAFDLVLNRHESYRPAEVARILRPGGVFLTQQVADGWSDDLHDLLGLPHPTPSGFTHAFAVAQAKAGGLTVTDGGEGCDRWRITDVAPLVWYVRITSWAVPGFDPAEHRPLWTRIQRRIDDDGPLVLSEPRFWFTATI